jgi:hypothetical protein
LISSIDGDEDDIGEGTKGNKGAARESKKFLFFLSPNELPTRKYQFFLFSPFFLQ